MSLSPNDTPEGFKQLEWTDLSKKYFAASPERQIELLRALAFLASPCFEFDNLPKNKHEQSIFLLYFRGMLSVVLAGELVQSKRLIKLLKKFPSSSSASPGFYALCSIAYTLEFMMSGKGEDAGSGVALGCDALTSWSGFTFEDNSWTYLGDEGKINQSLETHLSALEGFSKRVLLGEVSLENARADRIWKQIPKLRIVMQEFEKFITIQNEFAFWRDWYQGFLDGKPLDWELQRRVALIPDADWEQGPEHIAELIEVIRADFAKEQVAPEPRAQEFEPDNVNQLFQYPKSVSASLSHSSSTILQGFEAFRQESGINETPEFLAPLEAIPTYLNRISTLLTTQLQSAASEQALREEIGRLNAKVAQLETEVIKLKTDLDTQKKPWFGKTTTLSAGIATLVSGLWIVSGDEIGPKQRRETLTEYWEFFFPLEQQNTQPPEPPKLIET